jgi:type 1 glutamine amidotransferase
MKIPNANLRTHFFTGCSRALVCSAALLLAACGSSSSDSGSSTGGAQAQGGSAPSAGAPAMENGGASSIGTAGSTASGGDAQETAGSSGMSAAAGASTSAAGSGQGGSTTGGAGSAGGAGLAGASGTAGAAGGAGSNKVLIYAVTTGFRHGSIPAAAMALTTAAAKFGLVTEVVGATDASNVPDATKFTQAALAQYGAVVLLANSGEPIGYPATPEIKNLYDYVQGGGALVGIEDATHCYDGSFNNHPADPLWIPLMGGDFIGHPGGVALATCTTVGTHPSVMQLPATFTTTDEVYQFSKLNPNNQVVLSCVSSGASTPTVRPVSWVRTEGAGRYFYTALGHTDAVWTAPMDAAAATTRLVENHVLPGLLWTMKR